MINGISKDVVELNDYFESVIALLPHVPTEVIEQRKRPREDSQSEHVSKPKDKKPKINPHLAKAMKRVKDLERFEEDEEFLAKKKNLALIKNNCSIQELRNRLQNKIEELKKKREPKDPNKRKRGKRSKLKKNHKKTISTSENESQTNIILNDKSLESERVTTREGKVVFSKFDFSQMIGKVSKKSTTKHNLPTGKNYELLLLKASKEKERLEKLREKNPEKAKELIQRKSWAKAIAKAEGEKIKDDPQLLKKSLRRKLAKKKKSAQEWKARNEKVQENMQKRQEKRRANIQKRKEYKRDRQAFRKSKKSPGF